ncbi:VOC family protein [Roseibium sp. M-1]
MPKMIFINLPVTDLSASTAFYEAIGCVRNAQFSDDNASSMVWSDTITFQLLACGYFSTFTTREIANAHKTCQVLLAVSLDHKDDVDRLISAGEGAGGDGKVRETIDLGWLYNRAIADPDGHILELVWMDSTAVPANDG